MSVQVLHELGPVTNDFVYSVVPVGNNLYTGDGHGVIKVFNAVSGEVKLANKVCANAIRCMEVLGSTLVCAGDDGNVQLFDL